jgi:N-acyl-D-amino-acid deacylase
MKSFSRREFIKVSSMAGVGICAACYTARKFDIIIKNGTVFDGLGNPGKVTDIGIIGDKIFAIENLTGAKANKIINAKGLYVSPGFIDIHTHTDMELLVNPKGESKVRQGVTTEVSGNCGYSPFPLKEDDALELYDANKEKYGLEVKWNDVKGFLDELRNRSIGINYATFTGHGDIRTFVVGRNDVKPTPEQMEKMKEVLAKSMENGSLGLSTGLEYSPGSYADTEELIELCKVVKQYNGVYATHMRSEDAKVEEAIEEAIEIAKKSGVSLQISHFKACNKPNWHKVPNMLKLVHQAEEDGVDIMLDRYPYNAWGTGLSSFLPLWARQGNTDDILARLQDPELTEKISSYMNTRATLIGGWDHVMISSCSEKKNKKYEGKYISEAAEMNDLEATNFVFQLLIEERNNVGAIGFAMDEENLKKVLADPLTVIGSDGNATAPYGKLHRGNPHPRYYGTFARVLGKYCREEKIFDWQTAIKKMTSMSAQKLHLENRGIITKENFADITIFNPETVIDVATFTDPHNYAKGIEYVFVNGKLVIEKGEHTGELSGKVL